MTMEILKMSEKEAHHQASRENEKQVNERQFWINQEKISGQIKVKINLSVNKFFVYIPKKLKQEGRKWMHLI